jgi:hypothetical protein
MLNDFGVLISQYNSVLPTLTDGQYSELQVDANGRLLVQADVSVVIDFLGLNGAGDSSNILIVGTEDGTGGGTAHAIRVDTGGQVIISDGGSSITIDATDLDIRDLTHVSDSIKIGDGTDFLAVNTDGSINITDNGGSLTVDATNLDIRDLDFSTDSVDISGSSNVAVTDGGGSLTVDASDLDIRDLTHVSDSIKIGDGTDFLEINADGSINTQTTLSFEGTEEYNATDNLAAGADGLASITAAATPWIDTTVIAVGAGETLHVYGMDWTCDQNANARLITDDGSDVIVYKHSLNSSASPDQFKYWGEAGRIEIAGSATMEVKIQIKKRSAGGGNAQGFSSAHCRLVS